MFLQRRSRQLLDNNELKVSSAVAHINNTICSNFIYHLILYFQALWVLLDKNHSPPHTADKQLINYEDFLKVAAEAGPKCKYVAPGLTKLTSLLLAWTKLSQSN